jgi:hypothetical protein
VAAHSPSSDPGLRDFEEWKAPPSAFASPPRLLEEFVSEKRGNCPL